MLTIVRCLAEEAERRAHPELELRELLPELVAPRRRDARAHPRDARRPPRGGRGRRGRRRPASSCSAGSPPPCAGSRCRTAPVEAELSVDAVHQELSEFRYCTVFVVEGERPRRRRPRGGPGTARRLAPRRRRRDRAQGPRPHGRPRRGALARRPPGDDRPDRDREHARADGRARGTDHRGPARRRDEDKATEVVAVVAGEGNRRLFASLGAGRIIEGGQTMNPSTQDLVDAIESSPAPEVVVLPNNSNVVMSAEQAARLASKPVRVVRTESIPAGLAALVVYDSGRSAEANVGEMHEALEALAHRRGHRRLARRRGRRRRRPGGRVPRARRGQGRRRRRELRRGRARGARPVARGAARRAHAPHGRRRPGLERPPRLGRASSIPGSRSRSRTGGQPHYPLLISAE